MDTTKHLSEQFTLILGTDTFKTSPIQKSNNKTRTLIKKPQHMKYYTRQLLTSLSLILLTFCVNVNSNAQSEATPKETKSVEKRYQIQLAAYKNPQLINLESFKNVGHGITIEKNDKDIHRVLVKDLKDEEAAKTALAIIQAKGYEDAFYTTYQAEVVTPIAEAIPPTEQPIEPVFMDEIEEPKDEVFLVELGAFESVNLLHNTAEIRSMGQLFRQKVDGGERIYIGVFDDLALAELTLKKAKAQGYNTAGLRKVERSKILNTDQQNQPIQNVADRRNIKDRRTVPTVVAATVDAINQTFEKMNFHIFKVDAYDPTNTSSFINEMLKGKEMNPAVLAFFDRNADKNLQYFSIGSFDITPNYTGYMVRSGKGDFHNNNDIHLYIYDQQNQKMIGKELISSVMTTTNTYSKIQTWITDANKDGILDLLIYNKSETTTPDGQYASQNNLTGKVWTGNTYTRADITDAAKLKQKLGVN